LIVAGILGNLAWITSPFGGGDEVVEQLRRFVDDDGVNWRPFFEDPRLSDPEIREIGEIMEIVVGFINTIGEEIEGLKRIWLLRHRFTPEQAQELALIFMEPFDI
jgi:hypothetical protein